MRTFSIQWCNDESAGILCTCGAETVANLEGRACHRCGRKYTLVSYITVAEPVARCGRDGCDNWVYHASPGPHLKEVCSDACFELARRQNTDLVKQAADEVQRRIYRDNILRRR